MPFVGQEIAQGGEEKGAKPAALRIARFGALAFAKSWHRSAGRCLLLSFHYDILDGLEPDRIVDTASGQFSGRGLRRPPFHSRYSPDGRLLVARCDRSVM